MRSRYCKYKIDLGFITNEYYTHTYTYIVIKFIFTNFSDSIDADNSDLLPVHTCGRVGLQFFVSLLLARTNIAENMDEGWFADIAAVFYSSPLKLGMLRRLSRHLDRVSEVGRTYSMAVR